MVVGKQCKSTSKGDVLRRTSIAAYNACTQLFAIIAIEYSDISMTKRDSEEQGWGGMLGLPCVTTQQEKTS
jgi:cytosine/uracil/thiamine/allantoin permease